MARVRFIKSGLFINDTLAELPIAARYLFSGLWPIADRDGRLEDRPRKIKAQVLPFDDEDVDCLLQGLHDKGFILRYEVEGDRFIQIVKWREHQKPHPHEAPSIIPPPALTGDITAPESHGTSTIPAPDTDKALPRQSLGVDEARPSRDKVLPSRDKVRRCHADPNTDPNTDPDPREDRTLSSKTDLNYIPGGSVELLNFSDEGAAEVGVSAVAEQQRPTQIDITHKKIEPRSESPPDPRIKVIVDRLQAVYVEPYKYWSRHVRAIQRLLKNGYSEDEIVDCWTAIFRERNEFVKMIWVEDRIADFKRNGSKLQQRTNWNGKHKGYPGPPRGQDNTEYYRRTDEVARRSGGMPST